MPRALEAKVAPMPSAALTTRGSRRRTIFAKIRASTISLQRLNPFNHRRKRRRSATTDQILSMQHASALSATSLRSQGRQHEARAVQTLQSVQRFVDVNRTSSMAQRTMAEYLVALSNFFFACDYDEDGVLNKREFQILMEILTEQKVAKSKPKRKRRRTGQESRGLPAAVMLEGSSGEEDDEPATTTLDQLIENYGHQLYNDGVELPSPAFISRCQRLKVGFKRCDTNGDNVISVLELEIALQKLDLVLSDGDLKQLVHTLDANADGAIEWSEMVRAAWTNTHLGPTRNRNSVLLLDALADVPAPAISQLRGSSKSHGSTLTLQQTDFARDVPGSPRRGRQNNTYSRPSRLTLIALKMHLILPQEALDKRRSVGETDDQSKQRLPGKFRMEHLGDRFLTRISMHQVSTMKRANQATRTATSAVVPGPMSVSEAKPPAQRASSRRRSSTPVARTKVSRSMRRRVIRIEWIAVALAALIGVASGLLSMRIESLVPRLETQDEFTGDAMYYLYLVAINIGVSLLEVNLMYLAAVICAFRMTVATRLSLYPVDAEREFLTRAIARAALQVGHRKDRLFGMDSMKGSPRLVVWLSFLVIKSKRYVLKFLLKLLIRRVLWRAAAKTALSVLVLPINAVLNGWTLHSVMRHCRVTIIGPPCITALLEEFFDREEPKLLPYQRVDYLRVLGCVMTSKRCVHPNLEIIVHQVRSTWVNRTKWPIGDGCSCLLCPSEPCELHELDDVDRFLASLLLDASRLSPSAAVVPSIGELLFVDHQRNMFFFLVLGLVIDGSLGLSDRRLYVRACRAAQMQENWPALKILKRGFMNGCGLPLDGIFDVIHAIPPESTELASIEAADDKVPWRDWLLYICERLASLLSI